MKILAIAFLGALVLAGCGSVRYPATYVLNFPPPVPQAATSNGALGPIAVRELQCPEYLCEGRIVYRSSPEEVGFYEFHRWAMNPREAITQYVVEAVGPNRSSRGWRSMSRVRGGVCAERQHRATGGGGPRPRRQRRLRHLRATAGDTNAIGCLEKHGIGNGASGES